MVRRHERKKKYLRGWRRHGHGNIKNRRGSGNRGGRGRAGLHKHKWSKVAAEQEKYFGKKGFVSIQQKRGKRAERPTINLWEIANYIEKGMVEKEGDYYVFSFKGKVLGTGFLKEPVIVRAEAFTPKAKEKIEAAGGKAESL